MKGICTTCGDYETGYQLNVVEFICDPCASAAWIAELIEANPQEDFRPLPEDFANIATTEKEQK